MNTADQPPSSRATVEVPDQGVYGDPSSPRWASMAPDYVSTGLQGVPLLAEARAIRSKRIAAAFQRGRS